jgi:glycosyltransferase involved in cell wall biosynthesis
MECRTLAMAGYDVTLIVPHPGGNLIEDGVKIRVVTPPRNRRERMTRTVHEVYRAAVEEKADIYHFHDPELMPVGVLLKLRGKKVIYDVHEDYPTTMPGKAWIPAALQGPVSLGVRICEATLTLACDRIVAATPKIAAKFNANRTRLIQNFPWKHELDCSAAPRYEKREAIAVYVGSLSDSRGWREMTTAAALAAKKIPMKLVVAGEIRPGANAHFNPGSDNAVVKHRGQLNRSQVAELLAQARVGLVVLHPTKAYVDSQPTKLFEYMAAGLPVIASDFPIWRRIVESAGCGLLVDPLSPTAIAQALEWIIEHASEAAAMGQRGQQAIAEHYNWERESERLLATYAELLSENANESKNPNNRHSHVPVALKQ